MSNYGLRLMNKPTEDEIRILAYFKYIQGNEDTDKNWVDAENELNHLFYKVQHQTSYDYNI
jgi:hypothetical protein